MGASNHLFQTLLPTIVVVTLLMSGFVQPKKWLMDFAIETDLDMEELQLQLAGHGFRIVRKMDFIGNIYHIRHVDKCSKYEDCSKPADDLISLLETNPNIRTVEQQEQQETERRSPYSRHRVSNRKRNLKKNDNFVLESRRLVNFLNKKFYKDDTDYLSFIGKREVETKTIFFNDPSWSKQWQLHNTGQFDRMTAGLDLNVMNLYKRDYFGQDMVVTIVDDGLDTLHPEIKDNYDPVASIDLNDLDDVTGDPRSFDAIIDPDEGHGTMAAGEIGAKANNSICGVGVAHKVHLGGVRLLAGPVTDLLEAYAITFNPHYIDVYSNSWGPKDSGKLMKMPNKYLGLAFQKGAEKGRNGKGSIFVFASGNGGHHNDNCGADGYVNNPYTIAVTSTNIFGENTLYDEHCSALSVAVPVGGAHDASQYINDPKIITPGINNQCSKRFQGTSAAAPLAAACFALALQANPNLSWRDLQHLLPRSARLPNRHQKVWQRNGAGHLVSHYYGFGMLDCSQLVRQAQLWDGTVGAQHNCTIGNLKSISDGPIPIRVGQKVRLKFRSNNCQDNASNHVDSAEHVMLRLRIDHEWRGDLSVWIYSPAGTKSPILLNRKLDNHKGIFDFVFLTLMSWDENPLGDWILEISDTGKHGNNLFQGILRGAILDATLYVMGSSSMDKNNSQINRRDLTYGPAKILSLDEVADTFNKQRIQFLTKLPVHRKVFELAKQLRQDKSNAGFTANENHQLKELMKDVHVTKFDYDYLMAAVRYKLGNVTLNEN